MDEAGYCRSRREKPSLGFVRVRPAPRLLAGPFVVTEEVWVLASDITCSDAAVGRGGPAAVPDPVHPHS
jgi:hypothetical protein